MGFGQADPPGVKVLLLDSIDQVTVLPKQASNCCGDDIPSLYIDGAGTRVVVTQDHDDGYTHTRIMHAAQVMGPGLNDAEDFKSKLIEQQKIHRNQSHGQHTVIIQAAPGQVQHGTTASRLVELDGLRVQGSIKDQEYAAKREGILNSV